MIYFFYNIIMLTSNSYHHSKDILSQHGLNFVDALLHYLF